MVSCFRFLCRGVWVAIQITEFENIGDTTITTVEYKGICVSWLSSKVDVSSRCGVPRRARAAVTLETGVENYKMWMKNENNKKSLTRVNCIWIISFAQVVVSFNKDIRISSM